MSNLASFNVIYDRDSDVLYLSARTAPATRGISDNGLVWRYDENGDLIGVTILDFFYIWGERHAELAKQLADKFDIPAKQAKRVLDYAASQ